ncbi:YitT family protein [Arthrobacter antioxidans]|uniref:YitT family protein n=1 Tax=Arthrobacter antioxidans TaxID=2895818 RepID=UPI0020003731|nr:YitT family protein [Arthrobacter antioxidans]
MDTTTAPAPARADVIVRHSVAEDILGMVTGTFTVSLGLFLLTTSGAVTGGTAGLAMLLSYAGGLSFGVLFLVVNVPFFALAVWKKGWNFTLRTMVAVALVAGLASLHPVALGGLTLHPLYAALGGNLLAGVGLLILFRHRASLGGFNILALILQERLGWRAGYVQMALDTTVILVSFAVVEPASVLLSAVGAVVLNLVVALNHKPGRYLGA